MNRERSTDILLPYYGSLRGHYAQIRDGTVKSIIKTPDIMATESAETARKKPNNLESSLSSSLSSKYEEDFMKIQLAAARLVAIQEMAKRNGAFSTEDNRIYAESLLELGKAAQKLALLQQSGQIKDFSILLQSKETMEADGIQKKPITAPVTGTGIDTAHPPSGAAFMELDLMPSDAKDPFGQDNDDIALTPPKQDSSIAEAKPIGISIAGEGGIASAKPNAVAFSGPNGLAVASPKATAIAGVTAEEAAAFRITLPNRSHILLKNSNSNKRQSQQSQSQSQPERMNYLNNHEKYPSFTALTDFPNRDKNLN